MSRNLTFFILGLTAAVLAYLLTPVLVSSLEMITFARLPREFLSMMASSYLVAIGGYLGLFSVAFFILYLLFPVTYVWYHISSTRSVVGQLPQANNPVRRTDKQSFLAHLKEFGFIGKLAETYGDYLRQGADEKVDPALIKSSRLNAQAVKGAAGKDVTIAPVYAASPAEVVFNKESLIGANLLLGFFPLLARLLIGVGIICFGLSFVAPHLEGETMSLLTLAQPGLVALLFCLASALLVSVLSHFTDLVLGQNAGALARSINSLFHHNEWQKDLEKLTTQMSDVSATDEMINVLQKTLDKPMGEISKAVKALASDQESKLDGLLTKSLTDFSAKLSSEVQADATNLNKALKEATTVAEQMQKQQTESAGQFANQMDKQAATIAKHLLDMQKALKNSEKSAHKETEKLISNLTAEVEKTYKSMGDFVENNLSNLQDKQDAFEASVSDKDSILQDLHNTAKDLGTISNASGKLLEKFTILTGEMDKVLKHIQENGPRANNGASPKSNKLKDALLSLRQANSERTSELPDMD